MGPVVRRFWRWVMCLSVVVTASAGLAALGGGVAVAVVGWRGAQPHLTPRPQVPVPVGFEVRGIDVSHHQGTIDWGAVGDWGAVDFVYIKATEGRTHVDRRFAHNWQRSRGEGLATGAYHYFSLCRTGAEQAEHFLATVPMATDSLPAVVDVEPDSRCNRGRRWDVAEREVAVWIEQVHARTGVEPIVYASDWVHRTQLPALTAQRWVASYSRPPRGDWLMWQYTAAGTVQGIDGPVDQNVAQPGGVSGLGSDLGRQAFIEIVVALGR